MNTAFGLITLSLLRESLRHPLQFVLTVFSIAAGVAVVVGVDIVNDSASSEFERANQMVDGAETLSATRV